ncbi:MAG: EAL domain-containing protein [Halothiobacillaceae bacterium]|jgi:diguanylate cyclase (GGDEF)-like protein|nr:EAL domain-containing protein [Halothiobacillaceae bacterium]
MNGLWRLSFRAQLLLSVGLVLVAVTLGSAYPLWKMLESALVEGVQRDASRLIREIDAIGREALLTYDYDRLQKRVADLTNEPVVGFAVILDADGRVAAASGWQGAVAELPEDGAVRVWHGQRILLRQHEIGIGSNPVVPYGRLFLGLSLASLDRAQQRLMYVVVSIGAITLLVGGLLLNAVARRLARRLEALSDTSLAMAQGDLTVQADASGQDEVSTVARSLNVLNASVAERIGELRYRVDHDALTGLHSRGYFEAAVARLLVRGPAEHLWVCSLDLDHFQAVNDSAGYRVGDRLLCDVARLMQETIHGTEDAPLRESVLARIGPDEFAACWVDGGDDSANEAIAQSLLERICAHPVAEGAMRITVSGSVGLVRADRVGCTAAEILIAADIACYAAKRQGGGRLVNYTPSHPWVARRRQEVETLPRLLVAIEQESFEPWVQRIAPLRDGETHAEVLIRMLDINGSPAAPATFLPAAERFQLMPRIDRIVFSKVLTALGCRLREGRDWPARIVSLNVSGETFSDPGWSAFFELMLAQTEVPAERLVIEITESAVIEHTDEAVAFIDRMRNSGVAVALDDFGAGMSSFGYLRRFRADYLKIDGQFVRHVAERREDQAIVETMVELAQRFGMETVAEFVENDATIDVLRRLGVDYVQGYRVHKPSPLQGL